MHLTPRGRMDKIHIATHQFGKGRFRPVPQIFPQQIRVVQLITARPYTALLPRPSWSVGARARHGRAARKGRSRQTKERGTSRPAARPYVQSTRGRSHARSRLSRCCEPGRFAVLGSRRAADYGSPVHSSSPPTELVCGSPSPAWPRSEEGAVTPNKGARVVPTRSTPIRPRPSWTTHAPSRLPRRCEPGSRVRDGPGEGPRRRLRFARTSALLPRPRCSAGARA
jgi:hypothetical protein